LLPPLGETACPFWTLDGLVVSWDDEGPVARSERPIRITAPLLCDVCRQESDDRAKGWLAFQGREDDDNVCVAVFCPGCLAREFEDED
jgi:hypothetical protein